MIGVENLLTRDGMKNGIVPMDWTVPAMYNGYIGLHLVSIPDWKAHMLFQVLVNG